MMKIPTQKPFVLFTQGGGGQREDALSPVFGGSSPFSTSPFSGGFNLVRDFINVSKLSKFHL